MASPVHHAMQWVNICTRLTALSIIFSATVHVGLLIDWISSSNHRFKLFHFCHPLTSHLMLHIPCLEIFASKISWGKLISHRIERTEWGDYITSINRSAKQVFTDRRICIVFSYNSRVPAAPLKSISSETRNEQKCQKSLKKKRIFVNNGKRYFWLGCLLNHLNAYLWWVVFLFLLSLTKHLTIIIIKRNFVCFTSHAHVTFFDKFPICRKINAIVFTCNDGPANCCYYVKLLRKIITWALRCLKEPLC